MDRPEAMMDHGRTRDQINIFLSYARADGTVHARRFFEELTRWPRYSVEYDRHFALSEGFDRSIEVAIAGADVMIIILTDASAGKPWVRREILHAQRRNTNKQRIRLIVAQMTERPDVPVSVAELPRLNFVTDPEAWTKLHQELDHESLPSNGARPFEPDDGPTDARHATAAREATDRAYEEQRRAADVPGAADRLRRRVKAELEREQRSRSKIRTDTGVLMINEMPELPEVQFQDRVPKLRDLDEWLQNAKTRVVLVTGTGGTGKTAFLREFRNRLASRKLTAPADAFVYLAVRGYRQVSAAALLNDLALAAPNSGDLRRAIRAGKLSWRERLEAVLAALGRRSVIVAVDDAEDLLDRKGEIFDRDLRSVLTELIIRSEHHVRFLLVVRERRTYPIREAFAEHVQVCNLEKGLPTEHTTPFLKALDSADLLFLHDVPELDLDRLGVVSDGNPRFLELTYCLLRSDPDLTLADVFEEIDARNDERTRDPFRLLIHAVLARLDRTDRRVVQALAVYGAPVRPEAVDNLLEPYVPGIDSAPVLDVLAARALVRRDGDRYFLPPEPDAACVLESLPAGRPEDWRSVDPLFTLTFLRRRAADFYAGVGRRDVNGPDDLEPRFKEIGLRLAADDYSYAVELMQEIDDRYLTGWGQSGVLVRWREEVDAKIAKCTRHRASNFSYLISALSGEEDHTGRWTMRLTEVMKEPWLASEPDDRIRFGIQLADVQADSGYLDDAANRYEEIARRCRSKALRHEAVMARASRGMCLARLGAFDDARGEFDQARKWLPALAGCEYVEAAALLALNEGWTLGQLVSLGGSRFSRKVWRWRGPARTPCGRGSCSTVSPPCTATTGGSPRPSTWRSRRRTSPCERAISGCRATPT